MAEKPGLADLLRANPSAADSREKIERAQRLVGMAEANGVPARTYDLRHPFGGGLPSNPSSRGLQKLSNLRRK